MVIDNRIKTMNNDIIKIDQQVSEQLGIPIDTDRVARADGKTSEKDGKICQVGDFSRNSSDAKRHE